MCVCVCVCARVVCGEWKEMMHIPQDRIRRDNRLHISLPLLELKIKTLKVNFFKFFSS